MRAMSRDGGERGGATNVEMALLWSVIALFIFGAVQAGVYYFAASAALTAAEDGLRSGRYYADPSTARAQQVAEAFLEKTAGGTLTDSTVTASLADSGNTIRVVVTGQVLSLVPGMEFPIKREAAGPVERLTP